MGFKPLTITIEEAAFPVSSRLFRRQNHHHGSPFEFGSRFGHRHIFRIGDHPFEQFLARLGEHDLPPSEKHGDLDLVFFLNKLPDMVELGLIVMLFSFRPILDLLDLERALLFFRLLGLFGLFIFEPAIVHDLAHRRCCIGRNLDKIQRKIIGRGNGLVEGKNP